MKTIRELLEELPEPYKTQALENATNSERRRKALNEEPADGPGIKEALISSFEWDESKEGITYWHMWQADIGLYLLISGIIMLILSGK